MRRKGFAATNSLAGVVVTGLSVETVFFLSGDDLARTGAGDDMERRIIVEGMFPCAESGGSKPFRQEGVFEIRKFVA